MVCPAVPGATLRPMSARRLVATLVVTICVLVPFVEVFDTWDNTIQDGHDTEADVVVAALCVGMAFFVSATAPAVTAAVLASATPLPLLSLRIDVRRTLHLPSDTPRSGSSPPLRI